MNPLTQRMYSANYYKILEKRVNLPVYEFKAKFTQTVAENQVVVLVGETGSGKTTQITQFLVDAGCAMPSRSPKRPPHADICAVCAAHCWTLLC